MRKRLSSRKGTPKSTTPPEPTSPISRTLFDFAQRLKQESVSRKGEHLSPVNQLIDPVLEGDEGNVLEILVFILEQWPRILYTHTVIRDQVDHLRGLVYYHGPQEIHDRNKAWLVNLVEAWAKGMTFGYKVEITRPKGHRGQVPSLFPHLGEMDGIYETNRAFFESNMASKFREAYDDLMNRLKHGVQWKAVRNEYKEYVQAGRNPTAVVRELAFEIGQIFEHFLDEDKSSDRLPLSEKTLQEIARKAFQVRRGGNPRHKIACGLLGSVDLVFDGKALRVSPSLIESTLETLRRHGIGARSRPSRSQSAKKKLR